MAGQLSVFWLVPRLMDFCNLLVEVLEPADPLGDVHALERQIRVGNSEALLTLFKALSHKGYIEPPGAFDQHVQEVDVMRKDNHLPLARFRSQPMRNPLASAMVKG